MLAVLRVLLVLSMLVVVTVHAGRAKKASTLAFIDELTWPPHMRTRSLGGDARQPHMCASIPLATKRGKEKRNKGIMVVDLPLFITT